MTDIKTLTTPEFINHLSLLLNDELHKIKDENKKKMATWWVESGSNKERHYNYIQERPWIKKLILTTITDKKERNIYFKKIKAYLPKYYTQEKGILPYNPT
jgi:hypothetical protein